MALGDLDVAPAFQRRKHHEQIGHAIAFVFVIVTGRLLRVWRGSARLYRRSTASRFRRGTPRYALYCAVGDRPPAHFPCRPQRPRWRQGGLPIAAADAVEAVFFSVRLIALLLARQTICSSTTFSFSSTRQLHRGRHPGAVSGRGDQFGFRRTVENLWPGRLGIVFTRQHRREIFLDQLAPGPLNSGDAGVQRLGNRTRSLQPSPASDTSAFKRSRWASGGCQPAARRHRRLPTQRGRAGRHCLNGRAPPGTQHEWLLDRFAGGNNVFHRTSARALPDSKKRSAQFTWFCAGPRPLQPDQMQLIGTNLSQGQAYRQIHAD